MSRYRDPAPTPQDRLPEYPETIRKLGKRAIHDIIEIGRLLTQAKVLAGHGNWLPWLEKEFGWTDDTALNYMRLYEMDRSRTVRDLNLPLRTLYLLAAPSTSPQVRDELIDRLERGEVTPAEVRQYMRPVPSPAKPPVEVSMTIEAKPEAPPRSVQPAAI